MTIANALNTQLFGSTGTGNFVGANQPTINQPVIVGSTSAISAGNVGEIISSVIASGSAISLTTATPADITSIALTAGNWDIWGNVSFIGGTGTTFTFLAGWINSTSATMPDSSLISSLGISGTITNSSSVGFCVPSFNLLLASPATFYLSVTSAFAVSTLTACGGIYARRRV
jgi:hypothetical protein